jgi:hypothetical protein
LTEYTPNETPTPDARAVENLVRAGVEAAQAGKRQEARALLQQAIAADPNHEMGWLWMASIADTLKDRYDALRRVVQINPKNDRARQELERVTKTMREQAAAVADRQGEELRAADVLQKRRPTPVATTPAPSENVRTPELPASTTATPARPGAGGGQVLIILGGITLVAAVVTALIAASSTRPPETPPANNLTSVSGIVTSNAALPFSVQQQTRDAQTQQALQPRGTVVVVPRQDPRLAPPTWTPRATFTLPPTFTFTPTPIPLEKLSVIFAGEGRGRSAIGLYTVSIGGTPKLLLSEPRRAFDATYSPDGKQIAFVTDEAGKEQVAVMNSDGTGLRVITQFTGRYARSPGWSPDGKRLVIVSDQTGSDQLYVINTDGTNLERLTEGRNNFRDPAWSPDGTLIVYSADGSGRGSLQIFTFRLTDKQTTQLTQSANNNITPSWSPDGTRIAFISTRERKSNVYIMTREGDDEQLITADDGNAENRDPSWSPDGKWIVFSSTRNSDSFNVFAMSPDGTRITPLTSGSDISIKPRFKPTP